MIKDEKKEGRKGGREGGRKDTYGSNKRSFLRLLSAGGLRTIK